MSEVLDFLKNKTFYLATVENDKPKIRPFGAVAEFENKIYFVTSNTKQVFKQIIKNPNISVCACDDNRKWVRIEGIAKQDNRIEAKQKMLDSNPILVEKKLYTGAKDPAMAIFYIENMAVKFY